MVFINIKIGSNLNTKELDTQFLGYINIPEN